MRKRKKNVLKPLKKLPVLRNKLLRKPPRRKPIMLTLLKMPVRRPFRRRRMPVPSWGIVSPILQPQYTSSWSTTSPTNSKP